MTNLVDNQFSSKPDGSIKLPDSVKFKTSFGLAKLDTGTRFKIKYIEERVSWFNDKCFSSSIPELKIEIGASKSRLGALKPFLKVLEISKFMFSIKDESHTLGTIAHELCHAYIDFVAFKDSFTKLDSHGVEWQSVMSSIGLPIDATFTGDAKDIMDEKVLKLLNEFKASSLLVSEKDFDTKEEILAYKKPLFAIKLGPRNKFSYVSYIPIKLKIGLIPYVDGKGNRGLTPIGSLKKTFDTKKLPDLFKDSQFLEIYKQEVTRL